MVLLNWEHVSESREEGGCAPASELEGPMGRGLCHSKTSEAQSVKQALLSSSPYLWPLGHHGNSEIVPAVGGGRGGDGMCTS